MSLLLEMLELGHMNVLEEQANLLERDLSGVIARSKAAPSVSSFNTSDIEEKLAEAIKRLQAARMGLGLTNKLKNPEDRKKNRSRIMRNLNLLRSIVQGVEEQIESGEGRGVDPNSNFGRMQKAAQDHDEEHNAVPRDARMNMMRNAVEDEANNPDNKPKPSFMSRLKNKFRGK